MKLLPRVAVLCSLCVAGCGSDLASRGSVRGRVTLDGKPLTHGVVYFVHVRGSREGPATAVGTISADGTYRLRTPGKGQGAESGTYRVYIQATEESPASATGDPEPFATPPERWSIPERYTVPATSGLDFNVGTDGEQVIDIELVTDEPP
jgi:hypothetical protein